MFGLYFRTYKSTTNGLSPFGEGPRTPPENNESETLAQTRRVRRTVYSGGLGPKERTHGCFVCVRGQTVHLVTSETTKLS